MTLHGQDVSSDLCQKLTNAIWDKAGHEAPIMLYAVSDESLTQLAEAISIYCDKDAVYRIRSSNETLTGEKYEDSLRLILNCIDHICAALDSVGAAKIDRLYVSGSSGRICPETTDLDVAVFVANLDASLDEDLLTSIASSLRTISSQEGVKQEAYSFIFDVGVVRACVTLCYSYDPAPEAQQRAVIAHLSKLAEEHRVTDEDLEKHSVGTVEQIPKFLATTTNHSIAKLKFWQRRNLKQPVNPFLFEVIAMHTIPGSLLETLGACLGALADYPSLKIPEHSRFSDPPIVVDPTNPFTNLADAVGSWDEISQKAALSLKLLEGGARLCDIFPPTLVKGYGA